MSKIIIKVSVAFFLVFFTLIVLFLIRSKDTIILDASSFTISVQKPLVEIYTHGGFCPTGSECSQMTVIKYDGTMLVEKQIKGKASAYQIKKLSQIISRTDFTSIKKQKYTGVCPTAFDSSETIYTFNTSHGKEVIPSCTYVIDPNLPIFKEVSTITSPIN